MLEILLLGQPEVRFNGELLSLTRRLVRHLMVYLACAPDRVGRSELATIFWQDADSTTAFNHLRDNLRRLREQLPDKELLQSYGTQLAFNPEKTYVDVRDFSSKVAEIKRSLYHWPTYKPVPVATLMLMQEAVQLWRTPRFLYGIDLPVSGEYTNWVIKTNQKLEMDRQYLLSQLAEHGLLFHTPSHTLEWVQMALEVDELNPDLNLQLLEILVELNRFAEAHSHIQYLKMQYEKRGYGELPAAIERIHQIITLQNLGRNQADSIPDMLSFMETPCVGQEAALLEVESIFQRGEGVIVVGEAGSGKTRFLHELEERSALSSRCMRVQCLPGEKDCVYQTIGKLLQRNVRKAEWEKCNPETRAALSCILADKADTSAKSFFSETTFNEENILKINDAIYQVLSICSQSAPVILALDDVCWCDSASLNAISYLAQKGFFKKTGKIIATSRLEVYQAFHDSFTGSGSSLVQWQRISLQPLEKWEITQITQFLTGEKPQPETIEVLQSASGGNALFLIEIIRSAMSNIPGKTLHAAIQLVPSSRTLTVLIEDRLRNLTPTERSLLNIAALYGENVEADVLSKVSGCSLDIVVATLENLEKEYNLIHAAIHNWQAGYSFVHGIVRETVVNMLYAPRKKLLHHHIAEALLEKGMDNFTQAAAIAVHYEGAGLYSLAIEYRLHSARFAKQQLISNECQTQLEQAERILTGAEGNLPAQDFHAVYSQWGELAIEMNDFSTMQRVFSALLQAGEIRQSSLLVGAGLSGLGLLQAYQEDFLTAQQSIDRSIAFLKQCNAVYDLMLAYTRKATLYLLISKYQQAEECYLLALQVDENKQYPPQQMGIRIQVHTELAFILALCGRPAQGLTQAQEAGRMSELAFQHFSKLNAHVVEASALYYMGEYASAAKLCLEILETAEKMGNGRAVMYLNLVLARVYLATGNLQECWQRLETLQNLEKRYALREVITTMRAVRGELMVHLGACELAELEFCTVGLQNENSFDLLDNLFWKGMLKRKQGDYTEGDRMVDSALQAARAGNMLSLSLPAGLKDAIWQVRNASSVYAERFLAENEQLAAASELGEVRILLLLLKCYLAYSQNNLVQARELGNQTLYEAVRAENVWIELEVRELLLELANTKQERNKQKTDIITRLDGMQSGIESPLLLKCWMEFRRKRGWAAL